MVLTKARWLKHDFPVHGKLAEINRKLAGRLRMRTPAPTPDFLSVDLCLEPGLGWFRKILVSVNFLSTILGPEMAAPILWGGECRFYFYGRGDFSERWTWSDEKRLRFPVHTLNNSMAQEANRTRKPEPSEPFFQKPKDPKRNRNRRSRLAGTETGTVRFCLNSIWRTFPERNRRPRTETRNRSTCPIHEPNCMGPPCNKGTIGRRGKTPSPQDKIQHLGLY